MFKILRTGILVAIFLNASFVAAEGLPPELLAVQKKLYGAAFQSLLRDLRSTHAEMNLGNDEVAPPPFDESVNREAWLASFTDWIVKQKSLDAAAGSNLKDTVTSMYISYYHDLPYARMPFLAPYESAQGAREASHVEKLTLVKDYPANHTLDVPGYVSERFPRELQLFVADHKVPLEIHDANCADTFAYEKSRGYSKAARFTGVRDTPDSQFLFVYSPAKKKYRFAVCDIRGQDDQTRMLAMLGPTFHDFGAMRVYHKEHEPLFGFNEEGLGVKLDPTRDRVMIGFTNTVWWQLKTASGDWVRRPLSNSGADVSVFENKATGERVFSISNVYGDEMKEAMKVFYGKGARRWLYMGTAGALDPQLQLGDVLLPKRFWKPDGTWFEFANDAEKIKPAPQLPARMISATSQGWVGTLIEETRDHLNDLKSAGVNAIDVESRYFAEFLVHHPASEKVVVIVVSDQPLGATNYNNENTTRSIPMKSVTELVPQLLSNAPAKVGP